LSLLEDEEILAEAGSWPIIRLCEIKRNGRIGRISRHQRVEHV